MWNVWLLGVVLGDSLYFSSAQSSLVVSITEEQLFESFLLDVVPLLRS